MISPNFRHLRCLVTGGCGFIGTNLVTALLKQGILVTVLDPLSAPWDHLDPRVQRLKVDLCRPPQFAPSSKTYDYAFHLAARTDLMGHTLADYRVNFEGTANLLQALAGTSLKRFIFYSTQLVVGLRNTTRPLDTTAPYWTNTLYGQSKIKGERVVRSFCKKNKIPYTIIRPTSVYGPWGREPYRDFFLTVKKHRYAHMGKNHNLVSMCYVKNVVNLTLLAALHPAAQGQIYYGTDRHPYTQRQFDTVAAYFDWRIPTIPLVLAWIAAYSLGIGKLLGIPVPLYPFRLKNLLMNYCYDIKNSLRLGYDPHFDLPTGMRETLNWYVKHDPAFH